MLSISSFTRKRSRKPGREAGFSLLEILIVLMIIAMITTLVGPRLMSQLDRSKVQTARVQARALLTAVETMRLDLGRYPSTEEGLAILTNPPANPGPGETWVGPYLSGALPVDPWGRPYIYRLSADGLTVDIGSLGSDGREGGTGNAADVFTSQQ